MISRLDADLTPPQTFAQLKHFEILAWLIQYGYLEIKIAIPLKKDGTPESPDQQLNPKHIFHEKVGIFTDADYNQLVGFGSNNESLSGWERNVESFHVYCSWEGDRDMQRVTEEVYRFETLWNDLAPNVKLFEVPEAIRQKLLRYSPISMPTWQPEMEGDRRVLTKKIDNFGATTATKKPLPPNSTNHNNYVGAVPPCLPQMSQISQDKNLGATTATKKPLPENQPTNNPVGTMRQNLPEHQEELDQLNTLLTIDEHPGCLDFCLKSIPIKPWLHQIKILRRVAANFPQNFLIADEVGLGKTIETGLILRYLLVSQKVKRVLILAPASVQPQWQDELCEKFNLYFWSYSQGSFNSADKSANKFTEILGTWENPWNQCDRILASSHLVRRKERQAELLAAEPWDLIILDEAHHARRKNPQARKETPNSLLHLMQQLKEQTKALILLSATPMQIDPIEVFDLLSLLGLNGHWRYGDNFCNYFITLSEEPSQYLLKFWQEMSGDYFRFGGKPCPRLDRYLKQQNRLLTYQLQDTWERGQPLVNAKKLIQNLEFIEVSRQYLTVNTPLKELMFRHTRDTLRQYYQRGMLAEDIPQRIVQDKYLSKIDDIFITKLFEDIFVLHLQRFPHLDNRYFVTIYI